jgi:hypothetical protein
MPLPLVGAAAAVAGRVIAKKVATKVAKKTVKKLAEPKSAVKVVKGSNRIGNMVKNESQSIVTDLRKSGDWAKITAPKPGKPNTRVKINSGKTAKKAAPAKKAPSYWELKGLPSLVKINSGTGNKTVSPITYRAKATKKAAPAKRATGRK